MQPHLALQGVSAMTVQPFSRAFIHSPSNELFYKKFKIHEIKFQKTIAFYGELGYNTFKYDLVFYLQI